MPRRKLNELEMLEETGQTDVAIVQVEETAPLQPDRADEPAQEAEPVNEDMAAEDVPETAAAQVQEAPAEESMAPSQEETIPDEEGVDAAPGPSEEAEAPRRRLIFGIGLRELRALDANLSPAQRDEWNNIYSSYRSHSILTGNVAGVDETRIADPEQEGGERIVRSLVLIGYRVKILIPETEVWAKNDERPGHVMRGLFGAQVGYVVTAVDRLGECAVASRRLALNRKRRRYRAALPEAGSLVTCNVIAVGPRRCLVEYEGFDISLTQRDLSYTALIDLREKYRPGQVLTAVLKDPLSAQGAPVLSVKEVNPNPFDGAEQRHPVGSRRQAVISGKYGGGVFCNLPDGTTCLCLYSSMHYDTEFNIGDSVLLYITQYDYERKMVFGKIVSKW